MLAGLGAEERRARPWFKDLSGFLIRFTGHMAQA